MSPLGWIAVLFVVIAVCLALPRSRRKRTGCVDCVHYEKNDSVSARWCCLACRAERGDTQWDPGEALPH
jgi:hypothetical protein